jgi:hypothetical protein
MDNCNSQIGQDFDGNCLDCGQPIAASGCDGGSWVHVSTAPDRVVQSSYSYGVLYRQRLANGVIITRKGYRKDGLDKG